jgi:hypothetical protein
MGSSDGELPQAYLRRPWSKKFGEKEKGDNRSGVASAKIKK